MCYVAHLQPRLPLRKGHPDHKRRIKFVGAAGYDAGALLGSGSPSLRAARAMHLCRNAHSSAPSCSRSKRPLLLKWPALGQGAKLGCHRDSESSRF